MGATGFLLLAAVRETVRELAAVVGQQLDDLDRAVLLDFTEEALGQGLTQRRNPVATNFSGAWNNLAS